MVAGMPGMLPPVGSRWQPGGAREPFLEPALRGAGASEPSITIATHGRDRPLLMRRRGRPGRASRELQPMSFVRSALLAGLVALLVPFAAGAQALPSGVTRGPAMGGISEYNLANGLKVLLLPDPSQDTITVNVTYLVGSRHERLRRARHGAPARALALQGHAEATPTPRASCSSAARATTAPPRSTAPTTSRPSRRATTRSHWCSASRPTAWSTRTSRSRTSTAR